MTRRAMEANVRFAWVAADGNRGVGDMEMVSRRMDKGHALDFKARPSVGDPSRTHWMLGR